MKVTTTCQCDYLKVYFDGNLHLSIFVDKLIGVQAWVESASWYCIQYNFESGEPMYCQYEDVQLWKEILKQVDQYV